MAKRDHTFPKDVPATVFMMSNPLATPSAEQIERGVAVVTAEDNRWQRCDLKTISLVGNVLMRQLAADADAVETVMFRDGHLTEASASNVLVVIGGAIVAPPKDRADPAGHHLRRGVGFRARGRDSVRDPPGDERPRRSRADEMWLTSSTKEVLADHDARRPSRSPAASRGRSSGRCTRSSRRTSRGSG